MIYTRPPGRQLANRVRRTASAVTTFSPAAVMTIATVTATVAAPMPASLAEVRR